MEHRLDDLDDLLAQEPFVRALARQLVLDGARADDVVQQTWLAALQADRSGVDSRRAWLAAIVRRVAATMRRGEARRRGRERRVARPEADDAADLARTREDARRAVVDAVFALDEPWRTTLILRYLDGLPQREIAQRMGVPVETVHSRLRRALELLRARLDADHGGDRLSWTLGLVPLALPSGAVPMAVLSSSAVPGALAMLVKLKSVAVVLAIALIGCLWLTWSRSSESASEKPAALVPEASSASADARANLHSENEVAVRTVVPDAVAKDPSSMASPRPLTGGIEVHLRTEDPAAASGFVVQVVLAQANLARPIRASAIDGLARFEDLAPGEYSVSTDRFVDATCVVEAGAIARVTLDATAGFRITGRVIDSRGAGVEGATIFLSRHGRWQEDFDVAVSGANGAYAVDGMAIGAHVGARKPGYAASMMRFVFASRGEERGNIDLRLRQGGGAIAGRVTNVDGAPLAGARVVVDAEAFEHETSDDGTFYLQAFERFAWSESDGTFRVDELLDGSHKVVVRAAGYAPFVALCETREGTTTMLEAQLAPGAIVFGIVRAPDGTPAAGVPVAAGREAQFSESTSGTTSSDGSFRLDSLPTGRIVVSAGGPSQGSARVDHDALPGVEQRVDLRLERTSGIDGRVENERGEALAGVRLDARDVASGEALGSSSTAADGTFRLACGSAELVDLDVFWGRSMVQPALRVRDVRVGTEGFLVRLPSDTAPSARITGRIEEEQGPVVGAEVLILAADGPQGTAVISAADGSFESPLLSPGRFLLSVRGTAHAVQNSEVIVLGANEKHDVGVIRLGAGGSLTVQLHLPRERKDARPSVWLERASDGLSVFVDLKDGVGSASKIAAGSYILSVADAGILAQSALVEIYEGRETHLDLELTAAATAVRFVVAAPSIDAAWLRVRIDEQGGRRLHAGTAHRFRRREPFEHLVGLDPGAYRVTVEGPGGVKRTQAFVVEPGPVSITVDLAFP
ncbi:MAG: sigma-70 family RNA polymerase sigma factor [Planctomycetes bacterium]|nr:sigma-70 family RNA polymerase sigma factor [Planctomycetota bacterium]